MHSALLLITLLLIVIIILILILFESILRQHNSVVLSTVVSQFQSRGFYSRFSPACLEFACSLRP